VYRYRYEETDKVMIKEAEKIKGWYGGFGGLASHLNMLT
jgi:hypothetical protein